MANWISKVFFSSSHFLVSFLHALSLFDANKCVVTFEHTFFVLFIYFCMIWFVLFCFDVMVNERVNVQRTSFLPHNGAIYFALNSLWWIVYISKPQSIIGLQIFTFSIKFFCVLLIVYFCRQRLDGQILPNWRRWRCVSNNKSTHNINC